LSQKLVTVDADTLVSTPLPKLSYIVDGLIPQGISLLCGASKIGKSWMVLWLAMQVAQGLPVWGLSTIRCGVLYLCLEDTLPRIQDRLYKLPGEAPDNLRFAQVSAQIGNGLETQINPAKFKVFSDV